MRTRTVVIGLAVVVIGIALFIGGALGALGSVTISSTFTQPHPGEYVSAEIVLNGSSVIAVASPAAVGGVVSAQNLDAVNSTNIANYALAINSTAAGSDIYNSLSGDFYYVAFSPTEPSTTIVATPVRSSAVGYGSLVLLGIVLVVAGIIIATIGAVQKKRVPPQQSA